MVKCPALPLSTDGKLSTLLVNHVDVTKAYHVCADRHADLVDALREQLASDEKGGSK